MFGDRCFSFNLPTSTKVSLIFNLLPLKSLKELSRGGYSLPSTVARAKLVCRLHLQPSRKIPGRTVRAARDHNFSSTLCGTETLEKTTCRSPATSFSFLCLCPH